jgi:drug/metabolite transporter (DMT)-like permease
VRIAPVFRNRDLVLRGISGLLGTAAYYWTIPSLGAGKATLICNTYVVFASVFALFSLGEKLNLTRLLWLLAAFAGIALLVGPGDGGSGFTFGFYEVLALFGAVMAAWAVVLVRHLSLGFSIGTIYLAQCLWILGPVAILAVPDLASLSWSETGLLALAATAASFGQLAMNEGYRWSHGHHRRLRANALAGRDHGRRLAALRGAIRCSAVAGSLPDPRRDF